MLLRSLKRLGAVDGVRIWVRGHASNAQWINKLLKRLNWRVIREAGVIGSSMLDKSDVYC